MAKIKLSVSLLFILLLSCIIFTGCCKSARIDEKCVVVKCKKNTAAGIVEYLSSQNMPAIKSVELWQSKYGDGVVISTTHYRIYSTLIDPLMLREIPAFMESANRWYQEQIATEIETKTVLDIYLFATRAQWEDFTADFAGSDAELYCRIKKGAYYLNGLCVAYNIGRQQTFSVLAHEGWHQFNSRHFKYRLPSWLDEGIAMQFEVFYARDGMYYIQPARNVYRLYGLRKAIEKGRMMSLKKLTGINPGEVIAADSDEAVATFYSQSYALVRFLKEDDYGKRLFNYQKMLSDGLYGKWPIEKCWTDTAENRNIRLTISWNRVIGPRLLGMYTGDDFVTLEQGYIPFCRKIASTVRIK